MIRCRVCPPFLDRSAAFVTAISTSIQLARTTARVSALSLNRVGDRKSKSSPGETVPWDDPEAPTQGLAPGCRVAMRSPGERVGRYELGQELGRGGMGVVFLGHDNDLGREVAIKVLNAAASDDEEHMQRVVREGRALAALRHPNVVGVFDIRREVDHVLIVMELVRGETLGRWWRGKSVEEIVACLADAGRGLAAAHAAGITHRDFKPANVLVDAGGHPRVLDFGVARLRLEAPALQTIAPVPTETDEVEALTRTGSMLGTPPYMSPEALQGLEVDHRSDQYSFAVTLYEGIYGRRPFPGRSAGELALAMSEQNVSFPDTRRVSVRIRRTLRRALSQSPSDRYPSLDALLADLVGPRTRRLRVVGVSSLVVTLAMVGFSAGAAEREVPAALSDHYRRAEIESSMAGAEARSEVLAALDGFVEAWSSSDGSCSRDAGCEACLGTTARHFARVNALLAESPEMKDPERVRIVADLPDPGQCGQEPDSARLPKDPMRRAAFVEARRHLADVRRLVETAKPASALVALESKGDRFESTAHPLVVAESALLRGTALRVLHDEQDALLMLERAYDVAIQYAAPELALQAALQLRALHAFRRDLSAEERWYAVAEELVSQTTDPLRLAEYDWVETRLLARAGDNEACLEKLKAIEGSLVDDPRANMHRGALKVMQSMAYLNLGDYDRVEVLASDGYELLRSGGATNSHVQRSALRTLSYVALRRGDTEDALMLNGAALDMFEAAEDPLPSEPLQHAVMNAAVYREVRDVVAAERWYAEAEAHATDPGADATIVFMARAHRGLLFLETGDWVRARDLYEMLDDECASQAGGSGYCSELVSQNLSLSQLELGNLDEARRGFLRATALAESKDGAQSSAAAKVRLGLAMLELEEGNAEAAEAGFAFAWRHLDDALTDARAAARFGQARALWHLIGTGSDANGSSARAMGYARTARELYASLPGYGPEVEEVDVWMSTR